MNRVKNARGYTIVETLIFLAVSGLMFTSAALLISGKQQKTEFQQGIRDFESQIQDIANDVSTGYYATNNDFSCSVTVGSLSTTTLATQARGTNLECIFIGRVLQFSNNDPDFFVVLPVVGKKQTSSGGIVKEVSYLAEAEPKAIDTATERIRLPGGMAVVSVNYLVAGLPQQEVGGFGVFTTFGQTAGGSLQSGSTSVDVLPINDTNLGQSTPDFSNKVKAANLINPNPNSGIRICLKSGGTNQSVALTISGNGRKFGTKTDFFNSQDCT